MSRHRILVSLLVVATVIVAALAAQDLHLMPADVDRRFNIGPLFLVYAIYAAGIAQFIGWQAKDHPARQHASMLVAYFGLVLALSVVPSGDSGIGRRVLFGIAYIALFLHSYSFWAVFPHRQAPSELRDLRQRLAGRPGPVPKATRASAAVVAVILDRWWAKALVLLGLAGFAWFMVGPDTHEYMLFDGASPAADPFRFFLAVVGTMLIFLTGLFAWSGYQLSGPEERTKALWLVLSHIFAAGWALSATSLTLLYSMTDSRVIGILEGAFHTGYMPVVTFVILTSFALATFYIGALDLRPIISRTTLYGGVFLALTFVFALVEEAAEAFITNRLGLPDGVGAWLGAGVIALALGPVRGKLDSTIKKVGAALEGGEAEPT